MNYSDTERMEAYLQALGFEKTNSPEDAGIVVFNTCSIRKKAEDRIFGNMILMRKIRKKNPKLIVAITGCMVRKSSSRYSSERDKLFNRVKELDIALKIDELPKLAELVRELDLGVDIPVIGEENLEDYFQINPVHNSCPVKTQAFVAISNGCDNFCTYCIVPYSRGREKSRKIEDVVSECEKLVSEGCKEITLIGQTVNSYGLSKHDKEAGTFDDVPDSEPFVLLLEEIDKLRKNGLERVRFTSPHPKDMSDSLIDAITSLKTQMPYLHLPVQSGDDEVLKRMNRGYTAEHYKKIIKKLRERNPDISISTDIIVGFCGETDEEFKNTCDFFEEMGFEHAYLAQYSERKGTVASKFIKDDIPQKTKKKRWDILNELLKKNSAKALERFVGRTVNVLVEEQKGDVCTGRSEHFKTVTFSSKENVLGGIVPVKITDSDVWILWGEIA